MQIDGDARGEPVELVLADLHKLRDGSHSSKAGQPAFPNGVLLVEDLLLRDGG